MTSGPRRSRTRAPGLLRTRSAGRVAAVAVGVLTAFGVAIGQAAAKSDVSVSAVLVPAGHGQAAGRLIDVTGRGADDAGRFQQLCVDRRIGLGGWRRLDCAPVGFGVGGTVHVDVPLDGLGPESFRASLFRVRSADGGRPVIDRVSRTVTVDAAGTVMAPNAGGPRLAAFVNRLLAERSRLR